MLYWKAGQYCVNILLGHNEYTVVFYSDGRYVPATRNEPGCMPEITIVSIECRGHLVLGSDISDNYYNIILLQLEKMRPDDAAEFVNL